MYNLLNTPIDYSELTGKEQEVYNYAKTASVLAEYGFSCNLITADKHGADFIAYHIQSATPYSIQLKGSRPTIAKKYMGKNIWIAYTDRTTNELCIYEHDAAVDLFEQTDRALTESWATNGQYSFSPTKKESIFENITIRRTIK